MPDEQQPGEQAGHSTEPRSVHPTDAAVTSTRLFTYNPVLATHDGPWKLRRFPVIGWTLLIVGAIWIPLACGWFVFDRLRDTPLLGVNEMLGVGAVSLFAGLVLLVGGRELLRGRLRHAPTGRKMTENRANMCSSPEHGSRIHAGLDDGTLTKSDMLTGQRKGGWALDLFVRFYEVPDSETVYATVYFTKDDTTLVWPPVEISAEQATELTYERFREPGAYVSYPHQ